MKTSRTDAQCVDKRRKPALCMVSQWQVVGGVVKRHCSTGEPDALKGASPVRRGAVGNVLSYETTRKVLACLGNKTVTRWPPTLLWRRAIRKNTTVFFQMYRLFKALRRYER